MTTIEQLIAVLREHAQGDTVMGIEHLVVLPSSGDTSIRLFPDDYSFPRNTHNVTDVEIQYGLPPGTLTQ